ncbi:MAG: DegT/DnrJ/EryC1/StrS family aminotransferase [Solirubrobacteraceae bacterium]
MSDWVVPLTDLSISEADIEAVLECLRSGWLTMGPRTAAFEQALAEWTGSPQAVTVSSGTAALHLASLAAGLGPGDEVIVPAFTFVASAGGPRYTGATPVFCDAISPHDFNLDPADVERRITARTKAVVAVHFCGYPARVQELRELCEERGLTLIEDCAQAIGARVDEAGRQAGTVGALGAFSFFSKKQLCVGEGGMVTSGEEALAARVRLLRSHAMTSSTWDRHRGHDPAYDIVEIGYNFRLDEPRAALGLSRLGRLSESLDARRATVRAYRERLAEVPGVELCFDEQAVERSSHFAFPVLLADRAARDAFRDRLKASGIQTTWYPPLHTFSEYRGTVAAGELPNATEVGERHCALPLSATMTIEEVDTVVEVVRAATAGESGGRRGVEAAR